MADGEDPSEHRTALLDALATTLPSAAAGLACGLLMAGTLAVVLTLRPSLAAGVMPLALVSQSMPLVALTPLIVVALGRGLLAVLVITVSVTFSAAFVTVSQGLRQVPAASVHLLRAYGATPWRTLRTVMLPSAVPHLLAALRLALPQALLGVIIAEYLALGTGVGRLLLEARGRLDFHLLWTVAVVVTSLSVLAYGVVGLAGERAARRFTAAAQV